MGHCRLLSHLYRLNLSHTNELMSALVAENGPLLPSVTPLQVKLSHTASVLVAENGPLPPPVTPLQVKPAAHQWVPLCRWHPNTRTHPPRLTHLPKYLATNLARESGAPTEAVGIRSSNEKDCRLHPQDWIDDLGRRRIPAWLLQVSGTLDKFMRIKIIGTELPYSSLLNNMAGY